MADNKNKIDRKGLKVFFYVILIMNRLIDLDNINARERRKLRRWGGLRTDVDVFLTVVRDLHIPVKGKSEATQIKNAYKVLANYYNIDVEAEREKRKKEQKAEKKRKKEALRKLTTKLRPLVRSRIELKRKVDVIDKTNTISRIRKSLLPKRGKTVIIKFIDRGNVLLDLEEFIPTDGFAAWWKDNSRKLWVDSENLYTDVYPDGKYNIYLESDNIPVRLITQTFREGITNCMLTPIKYWAKEKYETAQCKSTKGRYKTILNKLEKWEERCKDGVPEDSISEIANDLQIDIRITSPFKENVFIKAESNKKALRTFSFMNTKLNHVDINEVTTINLPEQKSITELQQLRDELDEKGEFYTYKKTGGNLSSISTLKQKFSRPNNIATIIQNFEKETGLIHCKLDDVGDKAVSQFIKEGTNYNGTVDFREITQEWKEIDTHQYLKIDGLNHIDMKKAYVNFKACKFYCGFLGKITDFRKTDKIIDVGIYRITDIKIPKGRFYDYNQKMKMYMDNNVYTSPELTMLDFYGVSYRVVSGCWGNMIDFEFNDDMINTKDNHVSLYAKWTGICDYHSLEETFWLKCDEHFFNVARTNCGAEIARYYKNGEASFSYRKKHNYHLGHITSFITAYQRLNVIEQLMEIPIENVVRICVDGIYFVGSTTLKNVFRYKKDRNFNNEGAESYCSQVSEKALCLEYGEPREISLPREHFKKELHLGPGGCGKTHMNLTDTGLIRKLYVAPSWKLARAKENDSVKVSVWARLLSDDPVVIDYINRFNCLIIDEVSMMGEESKYAIFERFSHMKIIMCGDLGYQLPDIGNDDITDKGFDNIVHHNTDKRCACAMLSSIKTELRKMIFENVPRLLINQWVVDTFTRLNKIISIDDLTQQYVVQDMILTGTNQHKDKITKLFPHLKKYYIKSNSRHHQNGQIVYEIPQGCLYELQHAYTVHSIQGETAEKMLYIDYSKMFDSRHFYTAISRARRLDQIYLFNGKII